MILDLNFSKILETVVVEEKLRTSIWLDDGNRYLMPCEFTQVLKQNGFYTIKIEVLDPDGQISEEQINKKFLFGHPGKIIGTGILKKVSF
jgi:predicted RNA binding protein YcfA (HicA-like mRNA interferase family)